MIPDRALTFDPSFGNERKCVCGHTYYRHFDSGSSWMSPVGCKYCECDTGFISAPEIVG